MVLVSRGLRLCCEVGAADRFRRRKPALSKRGGVAFAGAAVLAAWAAVPAMEWLDGAFACVPVRELDDAFGGSVLLGPRHDGCVLRCLRPLIVYAFARWLVSHRDDIAAIVEILACCRAPRRLDPSLRPRPLISRHLLTPRRRRTPLPALRLCKRGPPRYVASPNAINTRTLIRRRFA